MTRKPITPPNPLGLLARQAALSVAWFAAEEAARAMRASKLGQLIRETIRHG